VSKVKHFASIIGNDLHVFRQDYTPEEWIPKFISKNLNLGPEDKPTVYVAWQQSNLVAGAC
jgi:hypothetical protein